MERTRPGRPLERVGDYPRPPALEPTMDRVEVVFAGRTVADTTAAWRVLETHHPPVYYLPPDDVDPDLLVPAAGSSFCEWKGAASYYDLVVGERCSARAAWTYRDPEPRFRPIRNHLAFYPARVDGCRVAGVAVEPQPGDFYGGWITPWVKGPFKGPPGTAGW